jgi:hypothetical protein
MGSLIVEEAEIPGDTISSDHWGLVIVDMKLRKTKGSEERPRGQDKGVNDQEDRTKGSTTSY